MLSVKPGGIKYHFLSLNLGLNPGLLDHWQTLYTLGQWPGQYNRTVILFFLALNILFEP